MPKRMSGTKCKNTRTWCGLAAGGPQARCRCNKCLSRSLRRQGVTFGGIPRGWKPRAGLMGGLKSMGVDFGNPCCKRWSQAHHRCWRPPKPQRKQGRSSDTSGSMRRASLAAARALAATKQLLAAAGSSHPVHGVTAPCFASAGRSPARQLSAEAADTWQHLQASYTTIKVEVDEGIGVATLTLNRPEALNALNTQAMEELVSACMYLDRRHTAARVIIITGAGNRAFAAGADIKEMATLSYGEVRSGVIAVPASL